MPKSKTNKKDPQGTNAISEADLPKIIDLNKSLTRGQIAQAEVERYVKLFAHRTATENIVYEPGTALYDQVHDFANELREVINKDPIMQELGIHFKQAIEPVVLNSDAFEACVISYVE